MINDDAVSKGFPSDGRTFRHLLPVLVRRKSIGTGPGMDHLPWTSLSRVSRMSETFPLANPLPDCHLPRSSSGRCQWIGALPPSGRVGGRTGYSPKPGTSGRSRWTWTRQCRAWSPFHGWRHASPARRCGPAEGWLGPGRNPGFGSEHFQDPAGPGNQTAAAGEGLVDGVVKIAIGFWTRTRRTGMRQAAPGRPRRWPVIWPGAGRRGRYAKIRRPNSNA